MRAFFFDELGARNSGSYGPEFEAGFLYALANADPGGLCWSRFRRGDLLANALCDKTISASAHARGTSHTVKMDLELFTTVVWDFVDAISGQSHTLDLEKFSTVLGRHGAFCIALPTMPSALVDDVDRQLRSAPGYLGTVAIDEGSPVQLRLIGTLCEDAVVREGHILVELEFDGSRELEISGAATFLRGEKLVAYGTLDRHGPPAIHSQQLSTRGALSCERYEGRRVYTVQERVVDALSRLPSRARRPYAFDAAATAPLLEVGLPEAKFVRYLLNPEHAEGRSKARFFRDVLAIEAQDWRYLAAQFYAGLTVGKLNDVEVKSWPTGFGARFNCDMPIKGLNGRTAILTTAWMMTPGAVPQLTTAFPGENDNTVRGASPEILSSAIVGDQRWSALHDLAHASGRHAAERCIPTPMKMAGSAEIFMEGKFGLAAIRVPDARREFARWLIGSGNGHHERSYGGVIYAKSDGGSYDRAVAYAKAYARVLLLNGVQCSVYSRLD